MNAAIRDNESISISAGRSVLIVAALALALAGCGPKDAPPVILTEVVPIATVGAAYSGQLSSEGGTAPVSWSLATPPQSLGWLTIDSNGRLSGIPQEVVSPAARFSVTLSDAEGRTDVREFSLEVRACFAGAVRACGISEGNACLVGSQLCEGGRFLACSGGAPSRTLEHCGPNCGGCGDRGDECRDGHCRCGTGGACESAAAPNCCFGDCVDRQSDVVNCGKCGQSCHDRDGNGVDDAPSGTTPACEAGSCTYACAPGHARCDPGSDSCVNVMYDVDRCGSCDVKCSASLANTQYPICRAGVCGAVCLAGYLDCNVNTEKDGCEVDSRVDPRNCGACGVTCRRPNGVNTCSNGECSLACAAGWADLNGPPQPGQLDDGCETSLNTVQNCGAVGKVCAGAVNALPVCESGVCGLSCVAGFGNCNGNPADGCEVSLKNSSNHCGGCGNVCSGDAVCKDSVCCIVTQIPGQPPRCL